MFYRQGVETEKCPSMTWALNHNEPTSVDIKSTLADGLAVPTVGYNAYATVTPNMDKMVRFSSMCSFCIQTIRMFDISLHLKIWI